ncbi:MAG: hypothetical protein ACRD1D_01855 [Acidimicrobiales bacterium]
MPNDIDQVIEEFFDEIDALFEAGEPTFEAMQEIIDQLRADLFG